jgi:hypothetical protein
MMNTRTDRVSGKNRIIAIIGTLLSDVPILFSQSKAEAVLLAKKYSQKLSKQARRPHKNKGGSVGNQRDT